MSEEIIFVVSQGEIYRDEAAREKLNEQNDAGFADEKGEILAVDEARWQTAQTYERSTWMEYNQNANADRNATHTDAFGGYAALPHDLGDVIELGCGVFTNLRYILQGREATSVTLLDPLVGVYQSHKNCTYKNGVLQTQGVETFPVNIIGSTIEDWQPTQQYDCVVMVNVLHHCQNASAVFAKIRSVLKPGGYLVFHEPPREIDPTTHYDAGHPLAPHAKTLDTFLCEFIEVFRGGWYFIGRTPEQYISGIPVVTVENWTEHSDDAEILKMASARTVVHPRIVAAEERAEAVESEPPPEPIKPKRKPRTRKATTKK